MKATKNKAPLEDDRQRALRSNEAAETPKEEAPPIDPIPTTDIEKERELLEKKHETAREAAERQIDRTVEEGVAALEQAREDAQAGFQSERDRIDVEERQALDSQALYAEMRGDRGGIGQAQYASIQNTAAVNRRHVNLEQQRLATETTQKIEQLRRQGEFQKADELMKLTQQYLSELMELERWAKEQDLSIREFNIELARWKAEYAWDVKRFGIETELKLQKLYGTSPKGGYGGRQSERTKLGELAKRLQELGLTLTKEMAEAMGWTEGQYEAFIRETGGEGGEGAPFQLMQSWLAALRESKDPAATWQEIQGSEWFSRLSPEQRAQLEAARSA